MNVQNTIVVNSNFSGQFGGMTFWVNGTGDPCVTYKVGADTVSKKLGDHVDPGTLISQTSVSFNQEWNQGHAYSGKTEVPCSKATITCNGFNNHNGSLTVYDSSGTVLETISIVSGTYTINKDDICRWNIGYNFPQGYASIGASFTVSLYK